MSRATVLAIAVAFLALPATGAFVPDLAGPLGPVGRALAASHEASGAPTEPDVDYPVAALGGCADKDACAVFCADLANVAACIAVAKAEGLPYTHVGAEADFPIADLGGCADEAACMAYCDDTSHLEACIEYAEAHGLWTRSEVEEAKKVLPFMTAGTTPGNCRSEAACKAYCHDDAHFTECIDFAEKAGLVSGEEAAMARKVGGKGPGDCTSRESCDAYCAANVDACIAWAIEHGVMSAEEAEIARKFMAAGMSGPGGCDDKESCRAYCNEASRLEECLTYFQGIGVLTAEEAAAMRASGSFGGPGGCDSDESCRAFCTDPANYEACDAYAAPFVNADPNYPQYCKNAGLGPSRCRAACEASPAQCGIDTGGYAGTFPAECEERGITDPNACRSYCEADADDHCGLGSGECPPGGTECDDGGAYCRDHPDEAVCQGEGDATGDVAPACAAAGITSPRECGTYCQTYDCTGGPPGGDGSSCPSTTPGCPGYQGSTPPPCSNEDAACWQQYCTTNPNDSWCRR